jgi:SPP1 family predicted phage head-tail adaptor
MLSPNEITSMTAVVASSLDQSVPLLRKTVTQDGYGHSIETWNSQGNVQVNIVKPTATQLQIYADIIGSKKAVMIRFMASTDIREGDKITYAGRSWLVQNIETAESFTFAENALMIVVS